MSTALNEIPGWYIEFQAAILRQAPRPGEIDQTTAEGWIINQGRLKKNLAKFLLPQPNVIVEPFKPIPPILELVSTVVVPATTSKFIAKEKFVVNNGCNDSVCNASVKINYLGEDFTEWYLSGSGKIEDPITEQTLRYHKLSQVSVNGLIIQELGGEAKAETTLSEMFSLMEKQKNGEPGTLLNNDLANLFYIKDNTGLLRGVFVVWDTSCGGGWDVGAFYIEDIIEDSDKHRYGLQVFSRK